MKSSKINIIGFILAFFVILTFTISDYYFGYRLLNSDASAPVILGQLLSKTNSIISEDWYYSTEITFLNTNLVYALGWKLFGSFSQVRAFAQGISLLIFYLACCYLFKKLESKYYSVWPIFLLLPWSIDYFQIVLFWIYYVPHITISLIVLSQCLDYIKRPKFWKLGLSSLISVGAGMAGYRQIAILMVPLFLATVTLYYFYIPEINPNAKKKQCKDGIVFSTIILSSGLIGLAINIFYILSEYKVMSWNNLVFTEFSIQSLEKIFNGYLNLLGYSTTSVTSVQGIITGTSLLALFAGGLLLSKITLGLATKGYSYVTFFYYVLFANLITILSMLFTNVENLSRYLIPVAFFLFPIICLGFENLPPGKGKPKLFWVFLFFFCALILSSLKSMSIISKWDSTKELRKISSILVDEGYDFGYAKFWSANVLTELSNGQLEVVPLADSEPSTIYDYTTFTPFQWLVKEDTITKQSPNKLFVLVANEDIQKNLKDVPLFGDSGRLFYADDNYSLFTFQNSEDLANYIKK